MKIKVSVTQEDINNGVRRDAYKCPLAIAIKRAVNEQYENKILKVFVGLESIHFIKGSFVIIKLPDNLENFIQCFDNKLPVSPFDFELEIPV